MAQSPYNLWHRVLSFGRGCTSASGIHAKSHYIWLLLTWKIAEVTQYLTQVDVQEFATSDNNDIEMDTLPGIY